MDVYIVYNNDSDLELIKNSTLNPDIYFHFIDDRTRTGLKESRKVKSKLAARLTPFAAVYENDVPIKAFYSEADDNVIKSLIEYLKK